MQSAYTKPFVLIAVKHEAGYWTPVTIAEELRLHGMLNSLSAEELEGFRKEILKDLVGRSAERFWASDAITTARAISIRAACRALHDLTIDTLAELKSGELTRSDRVSPTMAASGESEGDD